MARHWSERLSCQCGKVFRSMSAEAVHRHNFPTLCRRKKRADWEVIAGLSWTRRVNGHDTSGRPLYDYDAIHGRVYFFIVHSPDKGFGINVYNDERIDQELLTNGIEWLRTRKACQARAIEIMTKIRGAGK